tara:strand:- start:11257 stop:11982 length:726 start_codon:yes stop_codon:yes gene_type:complete
MTYIKNIIRDSLGIANYHLYKRFLKKGSRVLIYHAFGSKLRHDTYGISINLNDFERHLKYLSDNYPITDINNFCEDETTISLTIDDGYKCTLDAVNLLAKYNLPFSLFISTDFINKQDYLSDKDLIDVANMDISHIGSHCKSHMKLADLNRLTQKQEIIQSKEYIEELITKKIDRISYPHGSFNNITIDIMSESGYEYGLCSKKNFNYSSTNKYLLHRSEIISSDHIVDLKRKIQGYYDYY